VKTIAKPEPEPTSFKISNPSRLLPTQVKYLSLDPAARYVPVCRRNGRAVLPVGIVVLADANPEAPEDVSKGTL
jgi:hypothetical protein